MINLYDLLIKGIKTTTMPLVAQNEKVFISNRVFYWPGVCSFFY